MAKKGKTGYFGMFAFIALLINAIAWLFKICEDKGWFTIKIGNNSLARLLFAIASLILTLIAIIIAHDFAEHQSKAWRIIYWILAVSSILAIFFGVGINFAK